MSVAKVGSRRSAFRVASQVTVTSRMLPGKSGQGKSLPLHLTSDCCAHPDGSPTRSVLTSECLHNVAVSPDIRPEHSCHLCEPRNGMWCPMCHDNEWTSLLVRTGYGHFGQYIFLAPAGYSSPEALAGPTPYIPLHPPAQSGAFRPA